MPLCRIVHVDVVVRATFGLESGGGRSRSQRPTRPRGVWRPSPPGQTPSWPILAKYHESGRSYSNFPHEYHAYVQVVAREKPPAAAQGANVTAWPDNGINSQPISKASDGPYVGKSPETPSDTPHATAASRAPWCRVASWPGELSVCRAGYGRDLTNETPRLRLGLAGQLATKRPQGARQGFVPAGRLFSSLFLQNPLRKNRAPGRAAASRCRR